MNVKLQQVEERIVNLRYGTIDILLNAKQEFERSTCFVAGREWYVRELTSRVCYVFASVTVTLIRGIIDNGLWVSRNIHCPVQAANRNCLADFVTR